MNYLECKKIDTSINRAKTMLKEKAKKSGIHENFGQKEVIEIKDRFIDISDYSEEMNKNRNKLECFDNWCMTYTGR